MGRADDRLSPWQRYFIFLAIAGAIFWTKYLVLMHGGAVYGRLAMPPYYDDVTYFTQGMKSLKIFQDSGLWGVFKNFWTVQPHPHSPYSELGAFFAFLVGGPTVESAYAINAIAAALIAATFATAFGWSIGFGAAFFAFITSLRWFDQLIVIYHPDLMSSFAVATACFFLLWQDVVISTVQRAVLAATFIGLALLVKAPALPYSLVLIGLSFAIGAIVTRYNEGRWKRVLVHMMVGAVVILLIAGPYYVLTFKQLVAYIKSGFIIEAQTWAYQGSFADHVKYYLLRTNEILGYWPLAGLAMIGSGLLIAATKKRWMDVFRLSGLILVIAAAYLAPTLTEVKKDLFGGTIYALLLLTLGLSAGELMKQMPRIRIGDRHVASGVVIPAILVVFAFVQMSDKQDRVPREHILQTMKVYDGVYAAAKAQAEAMAKSRKLRQIVVYMPTPIPIASHAIVFRGQVDGVDIDGFYSVHDAEATALHRAAARADIVMVPDAAVVAGSFAYPVKPLLDSFREWISANPRFMNVIEVEWGPGKILIFRQKLE